MLKNSSSRLVVSSFLLAIGLILPYFTAHSFGIAGTLLLPMHIPVLLCGLLCGRRYGALCGLLVPVLSSALTGMPAMYPMLPIMAVQLVVMGFLSGQLYHKMKLSIYPALLIAMAAGWAAYAAVFHSLLFYSGGLRALSVTAALVQGIPGIALQLTLIPAILTLLKRFLSRGGASEAFSKALDMLASNKASCVIIRNREIIHHADGRGVSPLLQLYREEPDKLKGSLVVDKIIGKAAAMILVRGGASKTHALTMSVSGRDYLTKHNIDISYGRCIDVISAKDGNGICPLEKAVMDTEDPIEGMKSISDTIEALRKSIAQ